MVSVVAIGIPTELSLLRKGLDRRLYSYMGLFMLLRGLLYRCLLGLLLWLGLLFLSSLFLLLTCCFLGRFLLIIIRV